MSVLRYFVFGFAVCATLGWSLNQSAFAETDYPLTEDSIRQDGVPEGKVIGPIQWRSKIFPGTVRDYWIYVPQQYDPSQEACVFVVQDGLNRAKGWHLLPVLDNLIHKKEIPVQIGIFISPGGVPAANDQSQPRFNRSFEYDGLGDRYARFLVEEILPEVGKDYSLSDDPNDRAIAGASSGGICAFTVAWERPDQFRRVLSTIGTFVGLRGGDAYPVMIRKHEPKPIRVFLQDGSTDLNLYGGEWFVANQAMLSALKFAGYEVNHAWGDGGHNSKHAASIMPEALKWLWEGYPGEVSVGTTEGRRTDLLIPGEDWVEVSSGHRFTEGPAIDSDGNLYFTDIPNATIHKIDRSGNKSVFVKDSPGINGLMFGADQKLYGCQNGTKKIVRYTLDGEEEVVCEGYPCNDLVVLPNGVGFFTDPQNKKVWRFDAEGKVTLADEGIARPNGIIVSPDQSILTVADTDGRFTYSFTLDENTQLQNKQVYGHLHLEDQELKSGADGMAVDTEGRTYVTTRVGLQVLDQLGRVHFIIEKPQDAWLSNVVFGGENLDVLYATCGDKLYSRKIKATGVRPWEAAVKQPKPSL
ncbi:Gluconolactonase precursor [Thalassoglobus neptunius]|uniref:Gluconolactonase n=1 Tax=Thalassoglobus neptunius TaxID=1938619 RepID=A0A5C5X9M6_9PLAN|nr:SMP-30/gluconolactonase/LRE family protein [Thalassoglobus neptunius]TWT58562.1 Gluconolactonase precursor [Thalassoglobus neptunius]